MHSKRTRFGLALVSLCVFGGALLPGGSGCGQLETEDPAVVPLEGLAREGEYVPDQYIFFYKENVSDADIAGTERLLTDVGGVKRHEYTSFFKGFSAEVPPAGLEKMRRNPALSAIHVNGIMRATGIQSCPPWGLDVIDQATSIVPNDVYAYDARGDNVHVFVLDTGIRAAHTEFMDPSQPNMSISRVTEGTCTVCNDPTNTDDCQGHGTHLAGIVGGNVYGVAKRVQIHPIRIVDCGGSCAEPTVTVDLFSKGLDEVANQHVGEKRVVLLGYAEYAKNWLKLYDKLNDYAINKEIVIVTSAGNDAADACDYFPGGVPTNANAPRSVITVGAFGKFGNVWSKSNHGKCVDLFAPGVDIPGPLGNECNSGQEIGYRSGTSQAAAHVAGVAALLLEKGTAPADVKGAIIALAEEGEGRVGGVPGGTPNLALHAPLAGGVLVSPTLENDPTNDVDGCTDFAYCKDAVCQMCEMDARRCLNSDSVDVGAITCDANGECGFCGADGLECCKGSTPFCGKGLLCTNGVCQGLCGLPPKPDGTKYPCCNGGCFSAGIACDSDSLCSPCGGLDQQCCGTECNGEGLSCQGGACKKCGFPPDPNDPNNKSPCCDGVCFGSGVACDKDNLCSWCGKEGEECCGTECLNGDLTCSNGKCNKCGYAPANGTTFPCCNGACFGSGLTCDANQCVAIANCGAENQPCCSGSSCEAGLQCGNNVCMHPAPCGGEGQACCVGDTCNGGLYCDSTKHCATCGGYGDPCCPGPGKACDGDMACTYDDAGNAEICKSSCMVVCTNGKLGWPNPGEDKFVTQYDCIEWGHTMCDEIEGWMSRAYFNHVPSDSLVTCGADTQVCCGGVPACAGNLTCQSFHDYYEDKAPMGYFKGRQFCCNPPCTP